MWIKLAMPLCTAVIVMMWYIFGRDRKTIPVVTAEPAVSTEPVITTEPVVTAEPPVTTEPAVTEPKTTVPKATDPPTTSKEKPKTEPPVVQDDPITVSFDAVPVNPGETYTGLEPLDNIKFTV